MACCLLSLFVYVCVSFCCCVFVFVCRCEFVVVVCSGLMMSFGVRGLFASCCLSSFGVVCCVLIVSWWLLMFVVRCLSLSSFVVRRVSLVVVCWCEFSVVKRYTFVVARC